MKTVARECRMPRINITSIKLVSKPYRFGLCLPPKCGTSNWQKERLLTLTVTVRDGHTPTVRDGHTPMVRGGSILLRHLNDLIMAFSMIIG